MINFAIGILFGLYSIGSIVTSAPNNASSRPLEMLNAINNQRAVYGLSPLRASRRLMHTSQAYAQLQASLSQGGHFAGGTTPAQRAHPLGPVSEIVWDGDDASICSCTSALLSQLMSNPENRASILNPLASRIGIGLGIGVREGKPYHYWVQMFTPSSARRGRRLRRRRRAGKLIPIVPIGQVSTSLPSTTASTATTKPTAKPKKIKRSRVFRPIIVVPQDEDLGGEEEEEEEVIEKDVNKKTVDPNSKTDANNAKPSNDNANNNNNSTVASPLPTTTNQNTKSLPQPQALPIAIIPWTSIPNVKENQNRFNLNPPLQQPMLTKKYDSDEMLTKKYDSDDYGFNEFDYDYSEDGEDKEGHRQFLENLNSHIHDNKPMDQDDVFSNLNNKNEFISPISGIRPRRQHLHSHDELGNYYYDHDDDDFGFDDEEVDGEYAWF